MGAFELGQEDTPVQPAPCGHSVGILQRTHLVGEHLNSDRVLPSELTLHDKFEEILELTVSPVYESVVSFQNAKEEEEIASS